MAKRLAVVLASGGLDSTVAAALAKQDGRIALMHVQYGQQAAAAEQSAFESICEWLHPARSLVVSLGDWRKVTESPLVAPGHEVEDAQAVGGFLASTFVPMLAPAMLCRAAAWAYTIGAGRVVWGVSLDNPGNYPDHADAVRLIAWQLIQRSLPDGKSPTIEAPLAQYNKDAIVALAAELNVPIDLTYSCLLPGPQPCGRCIGCVTRAKAMERAGAV